MANRICFLIGGKPSNQQSIDKFLDSFQEFNLSSQADIALAFDSTEDKDKVFANLKLSHAESAPKSQSDDLFTFNMNSKSDESDDDDNSDFFFFFTGEQKKSNQKPKSDQSPIAFADEALQAAISNSTSNDFLMPSLFDSNPINPVSDHKSNLSNVNLIPIILPKKYQVAFNGAGTFRARIFYSLNQLKNDYDYIVVCESGNFIVKNVNLHALFDNYFKQKVLWGNLTENNLTAEWIKLCCSKWFANTLDWQQVLSPLYLWLNQPFIYRTKDLDEFFEVTEILDNLTAIAWTDFPYYIYMYYLMLYHGFKIRDIGIKSGIGVCESNSLGNIKNKNPEFKPMICKKSIQRHLDNENLFLVFGA